MLNPGQTGAKRQSWERYNPRDVLRDVIRSRPRASEAEIREATWEIIRNEREYLPAIFDYWFTNNYRQFFVDEVAEHSTAIQEVISKRPRASNQPSRDEVEQEKEKLRPILMDQVLSTGKPLRSATFGECAAESGWLREVAKQGPPNALVGRRLTERQLWNLRTRSFK
jgi:hypothetical protein